MDARVAGEVLSGGLPHHRREVDGVDQLGLRMVLHQPPQGRHDMGHGLPVIFPPVAGHQDHPTPLIVQFIEEFCCKGKVLSDCGRHGVDHRIPGEEDTLLYPFPRKVFPVGRGGTEVEVGDVPHQSPVHLLRKGRILVIGPEPRLHMAHLHLLVKGRQGGREGGGGVPMDQHQVGPGLLEDPLHPGQALAGDSGQGLAGLHDIQVVVRLEPEDPQDGVQHLPVLGRHAAQALHPGAAGELLHQGGHLDGLWPGAEDGHDTQLLHGCSSSPSCFFFSLFTRKIRAETAPAAHRASRSIMALRAPLVVSTTAHRPRMALMI